MNYAKLLPIGSYIDALNQSPKNLAHFLRYLDKNEELYNNYFKVNRVEGGKNRGNPLLFRNKVSKDLNIIIKFNYSNTGIKNVIVKLSQDLKTIEYQKV